MGAGRAILIALAVLQCAPAADAQERRENGWSERGLFIFGPGYTLDFWRQRAGPFGDHVQHRLVDCSDADFYCMYEGWFAVAVPRVCRSIQIGDSWTVGGVTTTVVARAPVWRDPHGFPPGDYFGWILMTDMPHVAYLYDPPYGIKALYFSADADARAIAESGRIDEANNGLSKMSLVSPDAFGWCRQ